MIDFTCGECGTRLRVNDALGGKRARCPRCREIIQIPRPDTTFRRQVGSGNCERCNRHLLPNEMTQEVEGKLYCSYCLTDLGIAQDGAMHDPTTLNIPGMVVLHGKEEREAARRFLDSQAAKHHDGEDEGAEMGEDSLAGSA